MISLAHVARSLTSGLTTCVRLGEVPAPIVGGVEEAAMAQADHVVRQRYVVQRIVTTMSGWSRWPSTPHR